MPPTQEITLVAAAARLKRSYNTVLRLVLLGKLEGRQTESGRWFVSEPAVARLEHAAATYPAPRAERAGAA